MFKIISDHPVVGFLISAIVFLLMILLAYGAASRPDALREASELWTILPVLLIGLSLAAFRIVRHSKSPSSIIMLLMGAFCLSGFLSVYFLRIGVNFGNSVAEGLGTELFGALVTAVAILFVEYGFERLKEMGDKRELEIRQIESELEQKKAKLQKMEIELEEKDALIKEVFKKFESLLDNKQEQVKGVSSSQSE